MQIGTYQSATPVPKIWSDDLSQRYFYSDSCLDMSTHADTLSYEMQSFCKKNCKWDKQKTENICKKCVSCSDNLHYCAVSETKKNIHWPFGLGEEEIY